jgi:hypothetical protein
MTGPPVRHYCTYFDSNYLARGLVLYQSLMAHSEGDFYFYVLCLDDQTMRFLRSLGDPNMVPIALKDLEAWDGALLDARANRSVVEYYFTLSPILPLYLLQNHDCDLVTYLDADLMFMSSPEAVFEELGSGSILVTEHRFPEYLKDLEIYGRFNVQCQSFRKDDVALACLNRWRSQCLEWCYDRLEEHRFADQKYLDEWPRRYGEALVIAKNPGIGVAPWNYADWRGPGRQKGDIVFYHFHGLKAITRRLVSMGLGPYGVRADDLLVSLYRDYVSRINDWQKRIGGRAGRIRKGSGLVNVVLTSLRKRDLLLIY